MQSFVCADALASVLRWMCSRRAAKGHSDHMKSRRGLRPHLFMNVRTYDVRSLRPAGTSRGVRCDSAGDKTSVSARDCGPRLGQLAADGVVHTESDSPDMTSSRLKCVPPLRPRDGDAGLWRLVLLPLRAGVAASALGVPAAAPLSVRPSSTTSVTDRETMGVSRLGSTEFHVALKSASPKLNWWADTVAEHTLGSDPLCSAYIHAKALCLRDKHTRGMLEARARPSSAHDGQN